MENPNGPAGVGSKGVVQTPGPQDLGIAEPNSIPPLKLCNVSPRRAKPSAIGRCVPLGEAGFARTPTSEVHSYQHIGGSDVKGPTNGQPVVCHDGACWYVMPNSTLRDSSLSQIARLLSLGVPS
jgi:hypothetical protein